MGDDYDNVRARTIMILFYEDEDAIVRVDGT